VVKSGRVQVASRTFDLKGDAIRWHDAQRRALDLGEFVDPRAGRETLGSALDRWHESRQGSIASKTWDSEAYALKGIPKALRARPLASLTSADWESQYGVMLRTRARSTVSRFRNTVSAFYTWAVGQKLVKANVIIPSRVPRGTGESIARERWPFTLDELTGLAASLDGDYRDIVLTLGLTGIRWGELAALRVRDVQMVPFPALRISRSKSDRGALKTTKSGKSRTVPVMALAWEVIAPRLKGKDPEALVFPGKLCGYRLNSNFHRDVKWSSVGRGRSIHDLRHTAATYWISQGVDLKSVQAWLGHSSAKLTADTYAHWLGSNSDAAQLARLNASAGCAGGARSIPENQADSPSSL
jgi:integrase